MASVSFRKGFLPTSTPITKLNERSIFGKHITPELAKHALSPIKELMPVKKVFTEYLYQLNDTDNNNCSYQLQQNEKIAVRKLFTDNNALKCDTSTSSKNDSGMQCNTNNLSYSKCEASISTSISEKITNLPCDSYLPIHNILDKNPSLSCSKIQTSEVDIVETGEKTNTPTFFGKHIASEFAKHALSPIKDLLPVKKVFTGHLHQLSDTDNDFSYQQQQNKKMAVKKLFTDCNAFNYDLNISSKNDSGIECSTSNLSYSKYEASLCKSIAEKITNLSCDSYLSVDNVLRKDSSVSSLKIDKSKKDIVQIDAKTKTSDLHSITIKCLVPATKKNNFDMLLELKKMNCYIILSQILSYLSAKEICKASFVSKSWRNIVIEDKSADERKKNYIKQTKKAFFGPNKENRLSSAVRKARDHKNIFHSMINIPSEKLEKPFDLLNAKSRHQSFLDVGATLDMNEKLLKCPRCQYPSKCERGSKYCCTRSLCQYSFCNICRNPYMDSHKCSVPRLSQNVPKIIVGSKQSKKNLKRL